MTKIPVKELSYLGKNFFVFVAFSYYICGNFWNNYGNSS